MVDGVLVVKILIGQLIVEAVGFFFLCLWFSRKANAERRESREAILKEIKDFHRKLEDIKK